MNSPHLPPPSCHVPTHYKLRSLTKVLFTVFIGLLSGATAAFVAVAWIVPAVAPYEQVRDASRGRRPASDVPAPSLVQQTRQRTIRIYDARKKIAGNFFSDGSFLAEAALLSSDGWAVFREPLAALPDMRHWEGVDAQGLVHRVRKVVADPARGTVFAQFDGEGFRIMPFANWDALSRGSALWSVSRNSWSPVAFDEPQKAEYAGTGPIMLDRYRFRVLPAGEKKSILLGDQGDFAGFAEDGGIVVPGWLVEYQIRSILDSGAIRYQGLSWRGVYVAGRLHDGAVREVSGWYVDAPGARQDGDGVRAGDVVVRMQGKPVDAPDLIRRILFSGDSITATVIRGGEEVDVTAEKTVVGY